VSTPIGAEGIQCTDGTDILIARSAAAFAEHMVALLDDPARGVELGLAARALVERDYSDQRIVQGLTAFYQQLLHA
jgi:glycosyltransferase involved in cell wall biosynthesis